MQSHESDEVATLNDDDELKDGEKTLPLQVPPGYECNRAHINDGY